MCGGERRHEQHNRRAAVSAASGGLFSSRLFWEVRELSDPLRHQLYVRSDPSDVLVLLPYSLPDELSPARQRRQQTAGWLKVSSAAESGKAEERCVPGAAIRARAPRPRRHLRLGSRELCVKAQPDVDVEHRRVGSLGLRGVCLVSTRGGGQQVSWLRCPNDIAQKNGRVKANWRFFGENPTTAALANRWGRTGCSGGSGAARGFHLAIHLAA